MAPRSDPEKTELLENLKLKDYGTTEYISLSNEFTKVKSTRTKRERNRLLQLFQFANAGDKWLMITGAICAVIQGSCFPVLSVIFGSMTNTFLAQYTRESNGSNATDDISNGTREFKPVLEEFGESMILYSSYYLAIAIIALITAFCQTFCWELAAERQVYRLRKIFFSQLLRQDISWYDQNKDEDFSVKLSDDLERVREGLGIKFSLVVQYFSTFVSGILIGFISNWRLAALITLVGPLMLGVSTYLANVSANSSKREQMNYAHAGSIAEEVLSNIRTVAAFCKEKTETRRYKAALEKGRKEAMRKYLIMSYGLAIVYFLMYTSYGLAFYFGATLVLNGLCTPGSIFTVFFSVMAGAFSVGNALPFINSVSMAAGAAASIFDVIERKPYIDPCSREGLKPTSVEGYIELKHVSFKYPARPDIEVLHDVSLKIEQGRVVAFVGSSGSGKSTLIGLILRFYDPTDGCITLDGIPLRQLNVNWLRKQIGVVAQEPILFSASIADNIRYGRSNVTQEEIEEAARIANAHHFIAKLPNGYQTLAGDRGSQLSGGQKQRIAIARALVRDPKILLLDEATSALDAYNEGVVQEALEKAMCGRTTIVVAHRLSTVRNADMIYVMKNGVIREGGQHQELIDRRGLYYNLVLTQTLESRIEEPSLDRETDFEPDYRRISRSSSIASVDGTTNGIECNEENLPEVSVWQLVKYNAKEWLRLTIGVSACAVTGFVIPAFSIFYSKIFEVFTLPRDQLMDTAEFWACMLLLLAVVSSVAMFTQTLCLTSAAEKLILRMRSKAFSNILKQPIAWFDLPSSSTGYLVTRLARDAPLIKSAAGLRVGHVLTAVVTMASGLIIALLYGWKLALILSIIVPLIAGATCQQNRILKRHQIQDAWYVDDAGRIASECIQNIRTVQGLGNEKMFVRQYMENLVVPFKKAKKDAAYFGVVFSLSQAAIYLMYAAAFRLGYYLVSNGDMVPSDVYKVFFALSFCSSAVGNTISYMQDYTKAKYAARRMMQLVNRKAEMDPTSLWGLRPDVRGNIEFADVLFTYPSRMESNVLRGISFKLAEGKSLALVGESGSGKSTVVAILERFYRPVRGSVSIDGHEISLFNLHHLRRNIGLVTQEPNLFYRSIKDNIAYGLDVNLKDAELMQEVINVSKSVNLHKFVTSLPQGYDTMVGDKGTQLSGGQKQRIAIARALIKNPRILLLDEATSALDTECEKIVQDALDRAREGRTCITIAHRLSTIQNADIIAVVNRGRIIEVGEHRELIARRGYYYKLTERQHI